MGGAGQWIEPWVTHWFNWFTRRAGLAGVGLPLAPVDIDRLPARVRDLTGEWAAWYSAEVEAARAAKS